MTHIANNITRVGYITLELIKNPEILSWAHAEEVARSKLSQLDRRVSIRSSNTQNVMTAQRVNEMFMYIGVHTKYDVVWCPDQLVVTGSQGLFRLCFKSYLDPCGVEVEVISESPSFTMKPYFIAYEYQPREQEMVFVKLLKQKIDSEEL